MRTLLSFKATTRMSLVTLTVGWMALLGLMSQVQAEAASVPTADWYASGQLTESRPLNCGQTTLQFRVDDFNPDGLTGVNPIHNVSWSFSGTTCSNCSLGMMISVSGSGTSGAVAHGLLVPGGMAFDTGGVPVYDPGCGSVQTGDVFVSLNAGDYPLQDSTQNGTATLWRAVPPSTLDGHPSTYTGYADYCWGSACAISGHYDLTTAAGAQVGLIVTG